MKDTGRLLLGGAAIIAGVVLGTALLVGGAWVTTKIQGPVGLVISMTGVGCGAYLTNWGLGRW